MKKLLISGTTRASALAGRLTLKPRMARVGGVKTLDHVIVPVPGNINPATHNMAIIWREAFGQFIAAAQYR